MRGEKSFIHQAFKKGDSSGNDFEIKRVTQEVLKKYGIYCLIPRQTEKYFGVRPDLISLKDKLVVEINGSIHGKNKVILQDEFKMSVYKENKFSVLIVDLELLEYLDCSLENYISPILMNLKQTEGLKANF
jgi:hypothetical protein